MAFDVISPAKLGQGSIGTSVSTFYSTPVITRTLVKDMDICNTTTEDINVTVYLVPSGDSPGDENVLLSNIKVKADVKWGGIFQWSGIQVLESGGTIQAIATAVGLTMNVSGGEAI